MKRLQIFIEPETDEALAAEAARRGVSNASIIRRLVAEHWNQHWCGPDRRVGGLFRWGPW
jgi:hypothetical protein